MGPDNRVRERVGDRNHSEGDMVTAFLVTV